jgi:hypothetical protein
MIFCILFTAVTSATIWFHDKANVSNSESLITIHHWAGFIVLILIATHILLHLKFIFNMTRSLFVKKKVDSDL